MGLFTNKKKGKPPHTYYPDILHWSEGDQIYCWSVLGAMNSFKAKHADYNKYTDQTSPFGKAMFTYKGVDESGIVYLEDEDGHLIEFEFYRLIKKARNETLNKRKLQQKLKGSTKYMELMNSFQRAFNELQEADNHPHRLGEHKKETE